MRRVCFFHAGCPDGFGAAWAVWRAWGDSAVYVPRGHDDALAASAHAGAHVVFVDIAPPNPILRALGDVAAQVTVLDHHVSSRERLAREAGLAEELEASGHHILFDLDHSGAVLAWRHFHPQESPPDLLRYVEDQDLWNWKLPHSREVNAAIASRPHGFAAWDELATWPIEALVAEGEPLVRAQEREVERALATAHPSWLGKLRVEAVNATLHRSLIGHELATRQRFGVPAGLVYRVTETRVDASIYSIGELDVAQLAVERGGGGHRNAAGFSVPLRVWLEEYL